MVHLAELFRVFPYVIFVFSVQFLKIKMNTYPAAFWSDDSSSDESRYTTTHHKRTKQRANREQRVLDSGTWEEILDGKGPWRQAGEYHHPKEELEAAKAERRRYEVRQRNRHEGQPQRFFWRGHTGRLAEGWRTPRAL